MCLLGVADQVDIAGARARHGVAMRPTTDKYGTDSNRLIGCPSRMMRVCVVGFSTAARTKVNLAGVRASVMESCCATVTNPHA